MKVKRKVVVFAVLVLLACQKNDDVAVVEFGLVEGASIQVDGLTRDYDYYVPKPGSASAYPLVFLLHGAGSSSEDLTGERGLKSPYKVWMELADLDQFIIVYPNGTSGSRDGQGWNDCRSDAGTNPIADDLLFIELLIKEFSDSWPIDSKRIYAAGTSNGGHMSLRLGMQLPNRIAAVAAVVAAMPAKPCTIHDIEPMPVLFMNGTLDPLLPYEGGEVAAKTGGRGTVLSTNASVKYWVAINETDSLPLREELPDIDQRDGSTVDKFTYANGRMGSEVVLFRILGGGHVEPSVQEQYSPVLELVLGSQNHDIEMAVEIWGFFKRHTR